MYIKPFSTCKQRGVSLVELIMFIVIIGIALMALLSVMNVVTRGSVDPMIHKQALAIAESLLEEVELQDFVVASGAASAAVTAGNRSSAYHIVSDYNNFSMSGITSLNGTAASGLSGYSASVAVSGVVLGGIPTTSAVSITVTVATPSGDTLTSVGYRTAY
jgi:MSHA pilin protein MshD